jgi:hypothetical protein
LTNSGGPKMPTSCSLVRCGPGVVGLANAVQWRAAPAADQE